MHTPSLHGGQAQFVALPFFKKKKHTKKVNKSTKKCEMVQKSVHANSKFLVVDNFACVNAPPPKVEKANMQKVTVGKCGSFLAQLLGTLGSFCPYLSILISCQSFSTIMGQYCPFRPFGPIFGIQIIFYYLSLSVQSLTWGFRFVLSKFWGSNASL